MRLKDKVAVITGAAGGIGFACAERFAKEGAKVVLSDVNAAEGEASAAKIREAGGEARFVACDVGDKAQVTALMDAAVEAYGRIDSLVANAGIVHAAPFLEFEEEDFDRVLRVNLKGAFLCMQAAGKQMAKQFAEGTGGGTIIGMSSVNGVLAIPAITPYIVSKGGMNQLTRVAALSLVDHGVRVNAIGPGSIGTDMVRKVNNDPEKWRGLMSRTPMKRLGEPSEIASVAVFLASEDSSYITGQVIYADGGRLPLNYTVPVDD